MMSDLIRSCVATANDPHAEFPLNNLPCGVFSAANGRRCGMAVGDMVVDMHALEEAGAISFDGVFRAENWNAFMALGPGQWQRLRAEMTALLAEHSEKNFDPAPFLHPLDAVTLHMPFEVTEFTDFYAGRHHATNVGTMFRGADNALPPNWLHIPVGYNGRASSVVVSGTDVRRPRGQIKGAQDEVPRFAPSARFDFELEIGAVVGVASDGPLSVAQADENIFGYVLLNDWSARDIQAWEYQPLGPFQSKATATTISPWIVMRSALDPFRRPPPPREVPLLPHLSDDGPSFYDVDLEVKIIPEDGGETTISRTNSDELYYSAAQQLAHHTSAGCPMRTGDLLGSGTISGPERGNRGSLLELSWGGADPLSLASGETRTFIEDGDTITLRGAAHGNGFTVGFGECSGRVLPALTDPGTS